MTSLDRAYKKAAALVKKMARATAEANEKFWNGREIIPAEEWHKKSDYPEENDCLQYIPDVYQDRYHFLCSPNNENQYKNRKRWEKDYFEFLNHRKDPEFGKYKCRTCPLNEFEMYFGIKDILRRYFEKNLPNYSPSCGVVNIFQCPYGYEESSNSLLNLGSIFRIVDESLRYCWDLTWKHDRAHYVDFQTGRVGQERRIISWNIWEKMIGLKVPRLPLQSVQDIFNVLTTPELLEFLLDEYIDAVGMRNYENIVKHEWPTFTVEDVEEFKEMIMYFFSENRELVKLESLTDCFGYTAEQEEVNRNEKNQREKQFRIKNPSGFQEIEDRNNSGICPLCGGIAKVYCMNCSAWVCADHWEQHGFEKHGFEVKIPDYYTQPWG